MTLILPYLVADMEYYFDYYDGVFILEETEMAHPKSAISKRNQWMVENSDLLIAYVKKKNGGAYQTLNHAIKKGIRYINIGE